MKITFNIITLFPEAVEAVCGFSILKRAQENKIVKIKTINLRDFGLGTRKQVDDTPYGGGAGMVLRVDVLHKAIEAVKKKNPKTRVILLTPKGQKFDQKKAKEIAKAPNITLICGHYEGFDERVRDLADEEISVGDYVLTGGEIAAATIVDAVTRLIPGVLGNTDSSEKESFENNFLEYPQYTKPLDFMGQEVPKVLLSGNHKEIARWRDEKSKETTRKKRPDLFN